VTFIGNNSIKFFGMHENTKGAQMQDHHKVVKSISGVRTMFS